MPSPPAPPSIIGPRSYIRRGVWGGWHIPPNLLRHRLIVLCTIGAIHRTFVFLALRSTLLNLAAHKREQIVAQLYPLDIYRHHFWAGLWLLQQTPPVPHVVARIAIMLAAWPLGLAQLLCVMNGCISIVTACLLARVIERVCGNVLIAFVVSLWFLLSTDLVVLEYVDFGQQFYENLGMCLVTACCALLPAVYGPGGGRRHAFWLGVLAALAALTRSSLSFLALVPAAFFLGFGRRRVLVAYLLPVLLLQGGWALKNTFVFGHFAWETSTWGGFSAAHSFDTVTGQQPLCDMILASPAGVYPDWFIKTAKECPEPFFAIFDNDMPPSVQAQDASMRARLGGFAVLSNSLAARLRSNEYRWAVMHFIIQHPGIYARRLAIAYHLLWQRIGDFGASFWAPFLIEAKSRALLDVASRGFAEKQRLTISRLDERFVIVTPITRPAHLPTISLAPLDALSIVVLHGVLPILAAADLWRRWRRRSALLSAPFWALSAIVGYGLFMFTSIELGENMRFRLSIEPAILALTAASLVIAARTGTAMFAGAPARAASRRLETSASPDTPL